MVLQVFSLGVLSTVQLALGFLLQIVVIAMLGAGAQSDAWVAAQALPMVVIAVATVAHQGAWQAEFAVAAADHAAFMSKQRSANGQLFLTVGVAVALLAATAQLWTPLLFPKFSPEQAALTGEMTALLLIGALLNAQSAVFIIALRATQRFVLPEVIALSGGVVAVVFTVLTIRQWGVIAAVWGSLARSLLVCLALWFLSGRALPEPRRALRDTDAWRRIRPLLMSAAISKSSPLVDRFLGSLAPAGSLTALNLALTGMTALASVIERALCTVPITRLGLLARDRDFTGMRSTYRLCLRRATGAALLLLLVLLALRPMWPTLAHSMISLDPVTAMEIWWACVLLVAFLVPAAAGTAVTYSFYALADTGTPARIGTIGFLLAIAFKVMLFYLFGLIGIVMGVVLHYLGNLVVIIWLLERRLRREILQVAG